MSEKQTILECVPNFSEGKDPVKINAIADAIRSVPGVKLLHIDISPAANRTVMTFAGEPEAVVEAAFRAIKKASEIIDMREQGGVHPRIGATDVCPLVPLSGITMDEAVAWSKNLAERAGALGIPVYLYEYSAEKPYRKALPDIRKGEYEGLAEKMKNAEWVPDFGPKEFVPEKGATVIGARDILVAFNISLNTQDVTKASYIADRIRERGHFITENGKRKRIPGLMPKVRAIGWYMADFECAQVSMNLLDYRISSPLQVWEACTAVASELGVTLLGSELIGLMPEACLIEAGTFSYLKRQLPIPEDRQLLIYAAIEYLGLNKVKPFDPQEKILEYALNNEQLTFR
ncbi:glutamate formimidoyltransferase [Taibaiella soli]|uniref:glutamate formimidoyltransferase n=1 Tax=Taibaiella soli TaxID=1649169 RepID=A0A2W2B4R5_9BACT|nr:glutamate formimidoyltransferase [Taibaiella soli]PZF71209.1 glutamate formimidoyltransferase [Taibaiella soli]